MSASSHAGVSPVNPTAVSSAVQTKLGGPSSRGLISRSADTHHLANLDALRSFAVGLVFIGHLLATANVRGFGNLGHFGVLLFFVHTALVLMLSMESLGLSGRRLYGVFLVRRVFRIYPLSILVVLIAVALHVPATAWLAGYTWAGWPAVFSNLLLTQNLTHNESIVCVLWSLPFEVQMYAMLPALYLLLSKFAPTRTALLVCLGGIAIAGTEFVVRSGGYDLEFLLTRYFPCFLAGVLAWRLLAAKSILLPGVFWIVLLLFLVGAYRAVDAFRVYGPTIADALHGSVRTDHGVWWPTYLDLVNDWVFCGVVGLAIPHFAPIASAWLNAVSNRIAQYSYGIYVSHVPLLWLCFKKLHTGSLVLSSILSLFLTAAVSVLLYHWLESPAIRFGKQLTRQWDRRTVLA